MAIAAFCVAINRSESDSALTGGRLMIAEAPMTRLLYGIEDYLEDASQAEQLPRWMRRIVLSIGRTVGETGDIIFRRRAGF